jgi:hypothetical protein
MPKPRGLETNEHPRAELATPEELMSVAREAREAGLDDQADHFERLAERYRTMKPSELKRKTDLLR